MTTTKILYAEDEIFLGKIVKESLESRNYEVHMVSNGKEVLRTFHSVQPHICLLDVMLPGKDGFSLAKEIKSFNSSVPILFLTAKVQTDDVVEGFKSGGNDYIKKPFSLEELIIRIENLLSITNSAAPSHKLEIFNFGTFEFNPSKLNLSSGDHTVKLSHKENELLKILCKQPHQPIPRKKIMMDLWGDDHFFNSRNLDVYITKLRSHLKSDPNVQIITLKGIGYRFVY